MPTKLRPGKHVSREIEVRGIDAPVVVTISEVGITLRVVGTRRTVGGGWSYVLQNGFSTELNVPSHLHGKPYELLQYQASKRHK